MSLTAALHATMAGLSKTQTQIAVTSSNVTNADKPGYTVKRYESDYVTATGMTVPAGGTVVGALDLSLYENVIESMIEYGYYSTIADYFENYTESLGTTDGANTLSSYMDNFEAAISALETSPSDSSQKVKVIDAAEKLAREIRALSSTVQDMRMQADTEIEHSVTTVNQLLERLDTLNEQIIALDVNSASTADAEDDRMYTLEKLAEYIDITYYIDDSNQMRIYTNTGDTLLDSNVHALAHTAVTSVTGADTYPLGFDAITLNGTDITTTVQNGKLKALIELRDTLLVDEQDKLDEFAAVLMNTVNTVFNDGTAFPARSEITSDLNAMTAADAFAGTGIVRVAVVDEDGIVQSFSDIDISTLGTVGAVVAALNGIAGMSATLNISGEMVLTADNAGEGISMNQMTSSVGVGSESFGMYFGFSNIFTNAGGEYIGVCDYLKASPESLASSVLENDAALAVGDAGLISGNGTTVTALLAVLKGNVSFAAAGGFAAQSQTLSNYANKMIAYIANTSENATIESDTAGNLYEGLKKTMDNATGVNIDEETGKMVEYEARYGASATILSTLQDLFEELINAVR